MAEKAQYFLEKSVPELKEWEKKGIFTKDEITSITKKRSYFEHRVNMVGCKPSDYALYAEYEMNLEALRKKRVKRFNAKMKNHVGPRRIFFILDRATRKFHGDLGLWMQYIQYAKKEKSSKVLHKALATCLKLHPTKPELWVFAAQTSIDLNSDMTDARSHMQRGLRFNKNSKLLWVEYAKLELVYIAKILTRRKLLGIDRADDSEEEEGDETSDMMKLPKVTAEEMDESFKKDLSLDHLALENVDTNPALNGAIPLAVFDQAMKEIPGDLNFAMEFWDLFAGFDSLNCYRKLLAHVLEFLEKEYPSSPYTLAVKLEYMLMGIPLDSVEFIAALSGFISAAKSDPEDLNDPHLYYLHLTRFIHSLSQESELDAAAKVILEDLLLRYIKKLDGLNSITAPVYNIWYSIQQARGKDEAARGILEKGLKAFPEDKDLLQKKKEGQLFAIVT